jgi:hypothetical protein
MPAASFSLLMIRSRGRSSRRNSQFKVMKSIGQETRWKPGGLWLPKFYDVVVVDLQKDSASGTGFIRRVKAECPEQKITFVSEVERQKLTRKPRAVAPIAKTDSDRAIIEIPKGKPTPHRLSGNGGSKFMAQGGAKLAHESNNAQRAEKSDHGVWASVLHAMKATIAEWNHKFLPSDGRRIFVEETADRTLRLRNRSATLIASTSPDGKEILLTEKAVLGVATEWRESMQARLNDHRQVVLWYKGLKTTPREVAYRIVRQIGSK